MYILWNFTIKDRKSFALKMPRGIIFAKEKKKIAKGRHPMSAAAKALPSAGLFFIKKREYMRK